MMPQRETSSVESILDTSSPVADLVLDLQELIWIQHRRPPTTMQLDTRPQLPKFIDQMNAETVDSSLCILSTYFNTSPKYN
jgi:hypothetical protein